MAFQFAIITAKQGSKDALTFAQSFVSEPCLHHAPSVTAYGPFCFPLGLEELQGDSNAAIASYAFTLTDGEGKRLLGFCMREPAGEEATSSVRALCILSHEPYFALFYRVLELIHYSITFVDHGDVEECDNVPDGTAAATLIAALHETLTPREGAARLEPGAIVRLTLPSVQPPFPTKGVPCIFTDVDAATLARASGATVLMSGSDFVELQVPPRCIRDAPVEQPTVPLATLVYHLAPHILATMLASLLLERRVVIVASDFERVATAARAAAALLHPMRWHNLFLPLLPSTLLDCLAAPTPYLVGLPAALAPRVTWASVNELVLVDLDRNTIEPELASPASDSAVLPGWHELVYAFTNMKKHVKSPREHTANATISSIVQEFLAATIGRYPDYVCSPSNPVPAGSRVEQLKGRMARLKTRMRPGSPDAPAPLADAVPSATGSKGSVTLSHEREGRIIEGAGGWTFHHSAFVASFRSKHTRAFADALTHTQLWQVFIRERIELMQQPYVAVDEFEVRVGRRRSQSSGLKGAVAETLQSLSAPTSSAALSRWTNKSSVAVRQFGRSAAGAMRSAWHASKGALESPTGSPVAVEGAGAARAPSSGADESVQSVTRTDAAAAGDGHATGQSAADGVAHGAPRPTQEHDSVAGSTHGEQADFAAVADDEVSAYGKAGFRDSSDGALASA